MNAATPYLLDNAENEAPRRMDALARLFDAPTKRSLEAVGIAAGWRCLEVGGGGGGIARWMAERVAHTGSVLCTDIDPRHIRPSEHGNLRIERHDVVRDPLPEGFFDLVHARLVLIHIPERLAVLERLIAALRPGGWLVIEDFDSVSMLPNRAANPGESQLAAVDAMRDYMIRGGLDPRFGRTLYGRFRELGLVEVAAEGRVLMFDGANGGTDLMHVNFEQVGEKLIAGGFISAEQLRADVAALDRPEFSIPSPIMWSVAGRRPSTSAG